jgi:hypothetical protein
MRTWGHERKFNSWENEFWWKPREKKCPTWEWVVDDAINKLRHTLLEFMSIDESEMMRFNFRLCVEINATQNFTYPSLSRCCCVMLFMHKMKIIALGYVSQ